MRRENNPLGTWKLKLLMPVKRNFIMYEIKTSENTYPKYSSSILKKTK